MTHYFRQLIRLQGSIKNIHLYIFVLTTMEVYILNVSRVRVRVSVSFSFTEVNVLNVEPYSVEVNIFNVSLANHFL